MSAASPTPEEIAKVFGTPVPWQCWDIPGFKACQVEAGHQAFRVLDAAGLNPDGYKYDDPKSATAIEHQRVLQENWAKLQPKYERWFVYQCQAKYACTTEMLKTMADAAKSYAPQEESKSNVLGYALAGAGLLAAFYVYKRNKS